MNGPDPAGLAAEPPRRRQSAIWTIAGALLGVVLLYAATRQIEARALAAILKTADLRWAAVVLAATTGFVLLKSARWAILLRFVPALKFRHLHAAAWIGLAVNFLVSHVGEFLRAASVARRHEVSVSAVVATIVVERVLDFLALLVLLATLFFFAEHLPPFVETALLMTGVIALGGIAGLYLLLHTPAWITQLVATLGKPLPAAVYRWFVRQFTLSRQGFVAIRNVRHMILAVALSVLQWLLVVLAIWCSARAVGEPAGAVPVMATLVLIIVGMMLPNSPMQIGTTQVAFTIGLGTGGIAATVAIAASLVYTMFLILPIMVVGGVYLVHVRRIDQSATRKPAA